MHFGTASEQKWARESVYSQIFLCLKITFLKGLHFFWLTSANTHQWVDAIFYKRDNLFPPKSCQVMHSTHFARSRRCQAYLLPSVTLLAPAYLAFLQLFLAGRRTANLLFIMTPKSQSAWTLESDLVGKWKGSPRNHREGFSTGWQLLKCICRFKMIFREIRKSQILVYIV